MQRWIAFLAILIISVPWSGYAESITQKAKDHRREKINSITLNPIGTVKHQVKQIFLEIFPQYAPALDGLAGFSHVWVLYWFHENDTPEERATLKVHPRRDPANPLTGVFATRSPARPNLIGLTACRILNIKGNTVEVADLDARDGSPIIDLKPYIPKGDSLPNAATPDWVKRIYPK